MQPRKQEKWKKENQRKAKRKRQKAREKSHNLPEKHSGRDTEVADEEQIQVHLSAEEREGVVAGEDTAGENMAPEETEIEVEIETETGDQSQSRKDKNSH